MQVIFEGQALRELVDYRGAHGVRWVMNGVPLGRMWDVNVKDPLGVPVGLACSKGEHLKPEIFQVQFPILSFQGLSIHLTPWAHAHLMMEQETNWLS